MRLNAVLALALALLVVPARASAGAEPLKLAISAPKGAAAAKDQAAVIEKSLGEVLGRPVAVTVLPTGAKAAEALAQGKVHAAWLSPVAYLEARANAAVVPLATFVRDGYADQKAVFVTSGKGPANLAAASGLKVAWLGESSTSSAFAGRLIAAEKRKNPQFALQQVLMPNHKAACESVIQGRTELAITYAFTPGQAFDAEPSAAPPALRVGGCEGVAGADTLRVIAESPAFPNDIIAAHESLPAAERKALAEQLLQLSGSEAGRKALIGAFDAEGLRPANVAALEAVRKAFAEK